MKAEEQMISALPDIKHITITPADEFMVIACDGIWNYMTSEEVVDFVKQRLDEGQTKISTICEEVVILETINFYYFQCIYNHLTAIHKLFGSKYEWRWYRMR